ncbi:MAG: ERCC4 domain-containing protein [Gammaproteobacteria bacterium]
MNFNNRKTPEMNIIDVIIDDREIGSPVVASLQSYPELRVVIKRLQLGDYQFASKIIFERKTLADFAKSIIDGRLFSQMCRLLKSPLRGVLVLEGTTKDFSNIGIQRESIQGALVMVNVTLGIPILRSKDPSESAQLMLYTINQASAVTNSAISRHVRRPKGKLKTQLHILQGLPGIGPERAKLLLKKFVSIEAVITASLADLQLIDGIGKKTAARILWAIK